MIKIQEFTIFFVSCTSDTYVNHKQHRSLAMPSDYTAGKVNIYC